MVLYKVKNTAFVLAVTVYATDSELPENGAIHPAFR